MKNVLSQITMLLALLVLGPGTLAAQNFTHDDTLRGSITAERAWWDLMHYNLSVKVDVDKKTISGNNQIRYKVLGAGNAMQVDLQPPLQLEKAVQNGRELPIRKIGTNAYLLDMMEPQVPGELKTVTVWYSGTPREAKRAPWDGGFSWDNTTDGRPFIATSCQGLGASVWWPCKDHMYDEPDQGMGINVTVRNDLMDVSNGRLDSVSYNNGEATRTFHWSVKNPINNYGVNVNIAPYTHFVDSYMGEKGKLSLDYYVLMPSLVQASNQFQQVKQMLEAFEYWFGPYPFYEDGYKLVEVPYLGMEHQSSVTYGNGFQNGYRGTDLSGTGWGLKWDFIIVHESGHEWFANNITYRDIADMWIHESFTNYSEGLFTEYHYGKEAGAAYIKGCRKLIANVRPIIGIYGVNQEGSTDMYYKGGNMLHTIRQVVGNDEKWRETLRGLNRDFYHQTVDGKQIEEYVSKAAGINLQRVFDQYLRETSIPVLEYKVAKKSLSYRWTSCVPGFDMRVKVTTAPGVYEFIYPTTEWKKTAVRLDSLEEFSVDDNFYIFTKDLRK
ncbi:MAG: M1 family metallopeptidase [Lewinellaceae bacterium]|nr:M1 family metallopeptidase [Lewinellaceae bacterium]